MLPVLRLILTASKSYHPCCALLLVEGLLISGHCDAGCESLQHDSLGYCCAVCSSQRCCNPTLLWHYYLSDMISRPEDIYGQSWSLLSMSEVNQTLLWSVAYAAFSTFAFA